MAVPDRVARRRLIARGPAWLLVLVAVGSAAGCERDPPGLEADVYVEAIARLTYADMVLFEEERLDSARVAILTELGTSAEALVAFAERHGEDIAYMHRIWSRIRDRVDSLERVPSDSVASPDSAAAPPPP